VSGGVTGFGSGGMPNYLPGRGFPEYGSDSFRDEPDDWVGGARGPAAIPSRIIEGGRPAPSQRLVGAYGAIPNRRAATIEDAGAPRLYFDGVLGHGDIPWSRPTYDNIAGLATYVPPTQMPSWSANSDVVPSGPRSFIPRSRKHIGSFTVRRPFGDTSSGELFTSAPLDGYVDAIPSGMDQQGRRWRRQSKTHNPTLVNRSSYTTAGSYGQTTSTLPTAATNTPPTSQYGAY
jgi:hypothetical protein